MVFAGDLNENGVGESWEDIGLDLSADTHARLLADGLAHQVRVPVERQPSYVKVVVYDYGAERVGSIMIAVSR